MFIVLSKSYLILNSADLNGPPPLQSSTSGTCLLFNLKENTTEPTEIRWPSSEGVRPGSETNGVDDKKNGKEPVIGVKVLCGCVSPYEDYIALCDEGKNLIVFNRQLQAVAHFIVKRACMKLIFKSSGKTVFGCDKSGDIYEYSWNDDETIDSLSGEAQQGKLLLGHCSMLLDFILTPNSKFIISCDRDEKIRVTNYPNTHNVERYCLGHKEWVSSLRLLDDTTLVTGSGDGQLILWDFLTGKQRFTFHCHKQLTTTPKGDDGSKERGHYSIKSLTVDQNNANYLVATFYGEPLLYLFKVIRNEATSPATSLELLKSLSLDAEPMVCQFDEAHTNFLWLLGGSRTTACQVYELKQDNLTPAFETLNVVGCLNSSEQLRLVLANEQKERPADGLFKHYYNNVEMYLERKRQRIEKEINKGRR